MTPAATIPCHEHRGRSPRQTCEWCGTERFPLKRLGVVELLHRVEMAGWNLTRVERSLGITPNTVGRYLASHAPEAVAEARTKGLLRHRWTEEKLTDPDALRRALRRYDGTRYKAAKALGVNHRTLVRAMARLIPGEFQRGEARKVAA